MKKALILLATVLFFSSLSFSNKVSIKNDSLFVDGQSFSQIKELTLTDFALTALPINLGSFTQLEVLDLSGNRIRNLTGLASLKQLETLIIDDNPRLKVSELNKEIGSLKNLQSFSAVGCELAFFPAALQYLTSLSSLNLADNNIQIVPAYIKNLDSLKTLDLSDNEIQFVDNGLLGLGRLELLQLHGNEIENLPHLFFQLAALSKLTHLKIDYNGNAGFTKKTMPLKSITSLDLYEFNEYADGYFLKIFPKLESLNVSGDASNADFAELFEEVDKGSLHSIHLESNALNELPYSLTNCSKLRNLELVSSNLSTLPSFMNRFQQLERLGVEVDRLEMNTCISSLVSVKSLSVLFISVNAELDIPSTIAKLKRLDTLQIVAKKVKKLPLQLAKVKRLKQIDLTIDNQEVENLEKLRAEMPNCEFVLNANKVEDDKNGLSPPLESVDVPSETMIVSAEVVQTIQTLSGTTLRIPANAFLDQKGNAVSGNVRVEYREFSDPIDMVFAGIPMTEEENGELFAYASAGMFEFQAYQQGEQLQPNPKNTITVDYQSTFDGTDYDLFELDPVTEKWKNIGKDTITRVPNISAEKDEEELTFQVPPRPIFPSFPYDKQSVWISHKRYKRKKRQSRKNSPLVIHSNSRRTRRDTTAKVYSEFKYLNRMKFKVDYSFYEEEYDKELQGLIDDIFNFNNQARRVNGRINSGFGFGTLTYIEDLRLEPNKDRDNFNLVVVSAGREIEIPVEPTRVPRKPEVAQRKLKQYYKSYSKQLDRRLADWKKVESRNEAKVQEYEQAIENFETEQAVYLEKLRELNKKEYNELKTFQATETNIVRSFSLMSFGMFNVDIKQRVDITKPVLATLQDSAGGELKPTKIYVLDKGNNGVLSFDNLKDAFYDFRSVNCLIAILKNDKIGVIKSQDFNKDLISSRAAYVQMDIYDMKNTTIDELRASADFF